MLPMLGREVIAVGIAVRGVQGRRRWSKLEELLRLNRAS
jgi:hypothetical protein